MFWFRYIDEIFYTWTQCEEKLKKFMENFNSFSHDIKFTYEFHEESMTFLDLKVISSNGTLMTSLYSEPTDCHQYLHYKSSHPEHNERVKRVTLKNTLLNLNHGSLKEVILKNLLTRK